MAKIPTLEIQLRDMVALLRTMADRVLAGLRVIAKNIEHSERDELIKLVMWDNEVDNLERAIDESILQLFATQQPLAYELRLAFACVKISNHLERMGDAVESLARQLAMRPAGKHRDLLLRMLQDTQDLFCRSYAAMFEDDLGQIHEIHSLDDKVDAGQSETYFRARHILSSAPSREEVEDALQIINIGARLEKIADLACDWAEQIDFAKHGSARRKLQPRKHRIAIVDNESGISAGMAACFLNEIFHDSLEISVLTKSSGPSPSLLDFSDILLSQRVSPQVFPVAKIEAMKWKRTLMVVLLGDIDLTSLEKDFIPFKTVTLTWPEVKFGSLLEENSTAKEYPEELLRVFTALRTRTQQLAQIVARA